MYTKVIIFKYLRYVIMRVLRMFKSYLARKKRSENKEIQNDIKSREFSNKRNLKKKYKKIKKRQSDN